MTQSNEKNGLVTSIIFNSLREQEAQDGSVFYFDGDSLQTDSLPGMVAAPVIRLPERELCYDYYDIITVDKQIKPGKYLEY
ncbi:hypothetical protein P4H71_01770 [Paenibacillus kribbensis]|uniref:hypothetical protein n=1 Tax=Paenibacillus kribbensis TaxID=172713 RepID=UPI002DBFBD99|nr:hypothetical protein [Paenibacillus kribbensis]MEC0233084.1 hypothetical protein [Paenibacillus kribbensis]